jgi:hypothetical protein
LIRFSIAPGSSNPIDRACAKFDLELARAKSFAVGTHTARGVRRAEANANVGERSLGAGLQIGDE